MQEAHCWTQPSRPRVELGRVFSRGNPSTSWADEPGQAEFWEIGRLVQKKQGLQRILKYGPKFMVPSAKPDEAFRASYPRPVPTTASSRPQASGFAETPTGVKSQATESGLASAQRDVDRCVEEAVSELAVSRRQDWVGMAATVGILLSAVWGGLGVVLLSPPLGGWGTSIFLCFLLSLTVKAAPCVWFGIARGRNHRADLLDDMFTHSARILLLYANTGRSLKDVRKALTEDRNRPLRKGMTTVRLEKDALDANLEARKDRSVVSLLQSVLAVFKLPSTK